MDKVWGQKPTPNLLEILLRKFRGLADAAQTQLWSGEREREGAAMR